MVAEEYSQVLELIQAGGRCEHVQKSYDLHETGQNQVWRQTAHCCRKHELVRDGFSRDRHHIYKLFQGPQNKQELLKIAAPAGLHLLTFSCFMCLSSRSSR